MATPTCFVGLDLSLNATGVAILRLSTSGVWDQPFFDTLKAPKTKKVTKLYEAERLLHTIDTLHELRVFSEPTLVAIEDYAYGIGAQQSNGSSVTNCVFQLGELGGCVRFHLFEGNIPWIEVPIQTNKKFASGNGAAKKDQVAKGVAEIWGLPPFTEKQFDASDALALASVAAFKHHGELRGKINRKFWQKAVEALEIIRK